MVTNHRFSNDPSLVRFWARLLCAGQNACDSVRACLHGDGGPRVGDFNNLLRSGRLLVSIISHFN